MRTTLNIDNDELQPARSQKLEIVDGIPVRPNKGGIVGRELVERLLSAADLEDGTIERGQEKASP